jgi:hypothetical protein
MANLIDQNFPDMFACDLAQIDRIGQNRRLIFTVPSIDEEGHRSVTAKLIIPAQYLPTLVSILAREAYLAPERDEQIAPEVFATLRTNGTAN